MMTADSDSNVWGRTLNPNNTRLTADGSTGSEVTLIALQGSIIGIGTNVTSSIQIPSLCNGIYGFKPSTDILPYGKQQSLVYPGAPGITPSAGPLATSARACRFLMGTMMHGGPDQFNPSCINVRWQGLTHGDKPLRVGVMRNDGCYYPTPPMHRALKESVNKLSATGVECIDIHIPDIAGMLDSIWDLYSIDGSKVNTDIHPPHKILGFMSPNADLEQFTRDLIASSGEPMTPSVEKTGLMMTQAKSVERLCQLNVARAAAKARVRTLWQAHDVDCIITLPAPHTATPLDGWKAITYTAIWNYLDYPAAVIPVGCVAQDDLKDDGACFGDADKLVYGLYTGPDEFEMAPTAVQIIGMRQHDEELLGMIERINGIINA